MKIITIRYATVEVWRNEARKIRRDMQKRNHALNSQYYSGRIAVLEELLRCPVGEVEL